MEPIKDALSPSREQSPFKDLPIPNQHIPTTRYCRDSWDADFGLSLRPFIINQNYCSSMLNDSHGQLFATTLGFNVEFFLLDNDEIWLVFFMLIDFLWIVFNEKHVF